jgi:hypothetical protein
MPSLNKGLTVPLATLVPSRLTRLWVSVLGAGDGESEPEVSNIQAKFLSRRSAQGSLAVFSRSESSLCMVVDELRSLNWGAIVAVQIRKERTARYAMK